MSSRTTDILQRRFRAAGLAALTICVLASAETRTVLLLHTNDLHDHVRIDYDGAGGLPYVSGYIRQQRATRNDVLVLDAGDVMEKGDLVSHMSQSRLTYRAMERVGYDAGAPGNHDDAYGLDHLAECAELVPSMALLCINLFKDDESNWYPSSRVFGVDGVRVGVIGMVRPRDTNSLTHEESAIAIAVEAERLDESAHLVVAVCHAGTIDCKYIASIAPAVDVFVGGHTHQAMQSPKITDTGAIIVQAGSYAEYVGRLELSIDLESEKVTIIDGRLVPMTKSNAPLDEELLAMIRAEEKELVPEARAVVTHTEGGLGVRALARLGAAAMREAADADIGFCHAGQLIRAKLPDGPVDTNAIFRTGQRAHALVTAELYGADIAAYILGLRQVGWGQTTWSGFQAAREGSTYKTSLDADKVYRVVMARKEWETRFIRFFDRHADQPVSRFSSTPIALTYTDAVSSYLRERKLADANLAAHCKALAAMAVLD